MKRVTTLDIETADFEADQLRERFLREHGWKHTSGTPGCFWLWEKKLDDGRTVLANTDTAYSIAQALDTNKALQSDHVFGEDSACMRCKVFFDDFERSGYTRPCLAAVADDEA